jgi:hypothetical protein
VDDDTFLDAADEALTLLDEVSLRRFPVMVADSAIRADGLAARVCALYEEGSAGQRALLAGILTTRQRDVIGRYGRRAATLALRERSAARLRSGLLAEVLTGIIALDPRDFMIGAALYHHGATSLGVDPAAVFDAVAAVADPSDAAVVRDFGRRGDVTLAAFGWREVATGNGPDFDSARWPS